MTCTVDAFLAQTAGQVGYKEGANNNTKFGAWYGMNNEPWCDMAVSYNAAAVGATDIIGRFAYVPSHVNWFKARGQWGGTPRPGAIVFYDWNADGLADHVGVVESVTDGGDIVTLEGNTSADTAGSQSNGDGFYRRHRTTRYVLGYGYPAYAVNARVAKASNSSAARSYTIPSGGTLGKAAAVLGVSVTALAGWNHIANADKVQPGQVVTAPPATYRPAVTATHVYTAPAKPAATAKAVSAPKAANPSPRVYVPRHAPKAVTRAYSAPVWLIKAQRGAYVNRLRPGVTGSTSVYRYQAALNARFGARLPLSGAFDKATVQATRNAYASLRRANAHGGWFVADSPGTGLLSVLHVPVLK